MERITIEETGEEKDVEADDCSVEFTGFQRAQMKTVNRHQAKRKTKSRRCQMEEQSGTKLSPSM